MYGGRDKMIKLHLLPGAFRFAVQSFGKALFLEHLKHKKNEKSLLVSVFHGIYFVRMGANPE